MTEVKDQKPLLATRVIRVLSDDWALGDGPLDALANLANVPAGD